MHNSKIIITPFVFLFFLFGFNVNSQNSQQTQINAKQEKVKYYLNTLEQYYSNGDYEMHKIYSDSLLQIGIENDFVKTQIIALTNQAIYYKNRSKLIKAIELYHEALEKCELIPEDFRTKIVVLVNMGNIYNSIDSYDKSIKYFNDVLTLLDANENSDKIRAAALIGIANNYIEFSDYENTVLYSNKAKVLGKQIGNEEIILSAINNICDAKIVTKDYKEALEISQSAYDLSIINKPTKKRASFLLNIGIANYHLGKSDEAIKNLTACKTLSEEKKILETQMYAHEFLAKIHEQNKDYKASVLEQKKYVAIRDLFLKDKKDASNADLNKEINLKSEEIAKSEEDLQEVSKNNNLLFIWGGFSLILLSVLLFLYAKRKNSLDKEQAKLQAQHLALQQSFTELQSKSLNVSTHKASNLKPYKNSALTTAKREELENTILDYMTSKKPYLDSEMTQSDLCEKLGISSHHFSEVLYYNMEQNFYNFINTYRILEAQKLMKDSEYKDAKVLSIAFDSGFKSKTSFNRVFKNHTGMTPSEYRKK